MADDFYPRSRFVLQTEGDGLWVWMKFAEIRAGGWSFEGPWSQVLTFLWNEDGSVMNEPQDDFVEFPDGDFKVAMSGSVVERIDRMSESEIAELKGDWTHAPDGSWWLATVRQSD